MYVCARKIERRCMGPCKCIYISPCLRVFVYMYVRTSIEERKSACTNCCSHSRLIRRSLELDFTLKFKPYFHNPSLASRLTCSLEMSELCFEGVRYLTYLFGTTLKCMRNYVVRIDRPGVLTNNL